MRPTGSMSCWPGSNIATSNRFPGHTLFIGRGDSWAMNTVLALGLALTAVGLAGYVAGVVVAYPGRAFSLTAVMAGMTLLAVGRSDVEVEA